MQVVKTELYALKPPIDLFKALVYLVEALVDLIETLIDVIEAVVQPLVRPDASLHAVTVAPAFTHSANMSAEGVSD